MYCRPLSTPKGHCQWIGSQSTSSSGCNFVLCLSEPHKSDYNYVKGSSAAAVCGVVFLLFGLCGFFCLFGSYDVISADRRYIARLCSLPLKKINIFPSCICVGLCMVLKFPLYNWVFPLFVKDCVKPNGMDQCTSKRSKLHMSHYRPLFNHFDIVNISRITEVME